MRLLSYKADTIMNNPLYRPPAEAYSLILQIDRGCPHNGCSFCGMYRDIRYRKSSLEEVEKLIKSEARQYPNARRIFLADGDVMRRPFQELENILSALNEHFPALARVNSYANGTSIARKSAEELRRLRVLKLQTLYMGLESGDPATLHDMHKSETVDEMVLAGRSAQEAGLRMSVMVLLGLGGKARTHEHAVATAEALNRMQPRLLAALRVVPVPGTPLFKEVQDGQFLPLSEREVVEELRDMVSGLKLHSTIFRANHSSNVVPVEARFPGDKDKLVQMLDELLRSGRLDSTGPGKLPLWL